MNFEPLSQLFTTKNLDYTMNYYFTLKASTKNL